MTNTTPTIFKAALFVLLCQWIAPLEVSAQSTVNEVATATFTFQEINDTDGDGPLETYGLNRPRIENFEGSELGLYNTQSALEIGAEVITQTFGSNCGVLRLEGALVFPQQRERFMLVFRSQGSAGLPQGQERYVIDTEPGTNGESPQTFDLSTLGDASGGLRSPMTLELTLIPTQFCDPNGVMNESLDASIALFTPALPAELVSFEAARQSNTDLIRWATASEQGVSHFAIDQSVDGDIYREVYSTPATGESADRVEYSAELSTTAPTNYYKLRTVDLDGSESTSAAVVTFGDAATTSLAAMPNPIKSGQPIRISAEPGAQVDVFDATGRQVVSQSIEGETATLPSLPVGQYMLRVASTGEAVRLVVVD